jgi:hypothetical protein
LASVLFFSFKSQHQCGMMMYPQFSVFKVGLRRSMLLHFSYLFSQRSVPISLSLSTASCPMGCGSPKLLIHHTVQIGLLAGRIISLAALNSPTICRNRFYKIELDATTYIQSDAPGYQVSFYPLNNETIEFDTSNCYFSALDNTGIQICILQEGSNLVTSMVPTTLLLI